MINVLFFRLGCRSNQTLRIDVLLRLLIVIDAIWRALKICSDVYAVMNVIQNSWGLLKETVASATDQ